MFGYIKPMTGELRVREHELYKSIYCGLCRAMGEHICTSNRLTLSYDIVFLALVRTAFTDEKIHVEKGRCLIHPLKRRNIAFVPSSLEYCSRVSAVLTYYNVLDDINDKKGFATLKYKLVLPKLRSYAKKADMGELEKTVYRYLCELADSEAECAGIDRNAECFGKLLAEIFAYGLNDSDMIRAAYDMGFHLGKWIYMIDAADDFEKDKRSGEYNPLSAFEQLPKEILSTACTLELAEAWNAFDSVKINNKALYSIVENILRLGMPETQDSIFKEKKEND